MLALLLCTACGDGDSSGGSERVFATKDGSVEFVFPGDWSESAKEHPYDLQCFSALIQMTTGVFVYTEEDLAEDEPPEVLLDRHVDELRSLRKQFELLTPATVVREGDKKLTTLVYSGVRSQYTNIYRITLIEFAAQPRRPLVAMQSALPENWPKHEAILAAITRSARLRETR
ncbi:MAG: hypothetical protein QNJ98_01275 [Planctomycetota bacterium]|nr:hypothetical protein [Planctomycetota bacterium]